MINLPVVPYPSKVPRACGRGRRARAFPRCALTPAAHPRPDHAAAQLRGRQGAAVLLCAARWRRPVTGVEMASTGEVACFGKDRYEAYIRRCGRRASSCRSRRRCACSCRSARTRRRASSSRPCATCTRSGGSCSRRRAPRLLLQRGIPVKVLESVSMRRRPSGAAAGRGRGPGVAVARRLPAAAPGGHVHLLPEQNSAAARPRT